MSEAHQWNRKRFSGGSITMNSSPRNILKDISRKSARLAVIALLFVVSMITFVPDMVYAASALTKACQAPALPPPSGTVVQVSTESQLQTAIGSLVSGATIVLQPGTYNLTSTLSIGQGLNNVTIRSASNSCDDVVLVGRGMNNANYGNVPHGIWIGNAQHVTIANLTIRDVYYHPIQLDPNFGAQAPHIYNVHLINAGEQFIKSSASTSSTVGVNNGIVEYSIMEYTGTARSNYTNGVDVHQGANWAIRHNLFRNIVAPAGLLAGPAVLMWNGSTDSIVESNLFLNVQYGIALGLNPSKANDHQRGIVRNNMFYRSSTQGGDVGITINNSAGTKVLNNTVIMSGTYPNAIEYRFTPTTGVDIRYNLTDAAIQARDGASGTVSGNVTNATGSWFVNMSGGDLHLSSTATTAINRAQSHPDVTLDYDDEPRPAGTAPDIGADEYGSTAIKVPSPPGNLLISP
jgi:hypothetical protein